MECKIQLNAKDLWKFSMFHANSGMLGPFNLFFTLASLYVLVTKWLDFSIAYRILLTACVLMFTVIQPVMLYIKAAKQAKTKVIREVMNLTFSEHGIHVSQMENAMDVTWEQVARVQKLPGMIIIYMDRIHAYLLPARFIEAGEEVLCDMVRAYVPKEKRKGIS